jgi:dTMP kinase
MGGAVLVTQEPGGTPIGRAIRDLLLDPKNSGMNPVTEVLLFFADRAQHVVEVVRPALETGKTVISDRYVDSSLAYQGFGRGIPLDALFKVAALATGGLRPHLTLFLDVAVETGLTRVGKRGSQDRLEAEILEFHERVREGYLSLMKRDPKLWAHIDAGGTPDDVAGRILKAVEERGLLADRALR